MSKSKNPYKKPDLYTKAAKKQGFPARSVFKLEEIDHRCRLLRPGQHVVDLGSAPGSWSLYVQRKIGFNGRLVSVDRQPLTVTLGPNASVYIVTARGFSPDYSEDANGRTLTGSVVWLQSQVAVGSAS